jgi:hypothetical protein
LAVVERVGRRRHGRVPDPAPPRLRAAALLVALVPFLVHAWVALHGYFGQDDFIITYRAGSADPLDFGYLFQDYNGHIMPGFFLLAWVETAVAPLNYAVAAIPLVAMHGVALWLFWRVLVRIAGYRWSVLAPFAVLTASPLVLVPSLWWAYAMQFLPLLVTMAAALLAHLRYLERGETRHAVQAIAWTLGGMLFFEKAALFAGILFCVTVLRGDTVGEALVRHWRVWTAHLTVLACYAMLYFALADSQAATNPVSADTVADFVQRAVVDTFLPGLIGGPFTATWTSPPLAVRVAAIVVTVAVIAVSRRFGPWLFLAGYLAVDLALVAVTRLSQLGPGVGADPRYVADAVPVAVLCLAFAFRGKRDHRWPMVAVAVLLVVGGVSSFLRLAPAMQFREARDYVANARAGLAAQPHIVLYDTAVPNPVIIEWFFGDNLTSRVLANAPEHPRFDQPTESLYQLDDSGRPQPITELDEPVRGERGPAPDCGHLVRQEPVRIPLTGMSYGRRVLMLGYYTGDTGDGVIEVGDTRVPVQFKEGLHVMYVVITGTYTHVQVSRNLDLQPLCVTDVEIGVPAR